MKATKTLSLPKVWKEQLLTYQKIETTNIRSDQKLFFKKNRKNEIALLRKRVYVVMS